MLFYFDFATYFRLLQLARRETNRRGRRQLLRLLLITVPAAASIHTVCFFLDVILFPGLRRTEVKAPVFIIGHPRSGTTLLHRLMSQDDERFSWFMYYELFLPSILQKKLIRALASLDRQLLGGLFERRVKAWEDRKFAATQHIHRMGLTEPEEDETVAFLSCDAGWWITFLPYLGLLDFYNIEKRPERRRVRLMRFYKECLRRQTYLNGPDKIHLSKNPIFSGRVESLIETFPDARFVVPFRNPNETIPSLLKMLQTGWSLRGWDDEKMQSSLRVLAEQSFDTYRAPLEVLERHPETRRAIVDYRELVERPRETLSRVYKDLRLEMSPAFDKQLEERQQRARKHETSHRYSLGEFGLNKDRIRAELSDLFERFDWDRDTSSDS